MPPPPLLTVNFFMYSLNALLATTNPPPLHVASKHYVNPRREIDNDCSLSQPRWWLFECPKFTPFIEKIFHHFSLLITTIVYICKRRERVHKALLSDVFEN